jgi:tetratricopeptide (TPR) repeat protein
MSSYSIKIIFISIVFVSLNSCYTKNYTNYKEENTLKESLYISIALDSEYNKQYLQSADIYEKLFDLNSKEEYLTKTVLLYHLAKKYKKLQSFISKNINIFPNSKEMMMQEFVLASVALKQYKKALDMSKKLLNFFNSAKNYTVVADIYYLMNNYNESAKYYESAYAKNKNVDILINISSIFYTYLNKKKEAISYLETYRRQYSCDKKVCQALLKFYQESQNIDGMISISNTLLLNANNNYTTKQLSKIYDYIVTLYIQKDINLAIKFLEKNHHDDEKLLTLYSLNKQYKKALKLTRKIYRKTHNNSLLGQIAILEYEINIDKSKIMKSIIANFEKSLSFKSNATYENYYGYILVDHNIDIKKGLKLIKKAIKRSPNNFAYKDSLAYAYYKNGYCSKAYTIMSDVKNNIGLDNSEIKKHWNEIKKCKEKNDIR